MFVLEPHRYYREFAACFCRGRLELALDTPEEVAVAHGMSAGMRLFKWKRNAELPRVRRVIGHLHGFAPVHLLDVGTGRGTFLWPLLEARPDVHVTAIDVDPRRADDLAATARGGLARLEAHAMDARALDFAKDTFDGVTALEVLEHLPDPERAVAECLRVARRFVIASVPSHEDDNPEHLHVLTPTVLEPMFAHAGARRVRFERVHNHLIVIATC
jgi:ubiquinone/menaquinone biosynthesis C-methylase UbiE